MDHHIKTKPPRKRASAPKVRSGCLTCKKRRKKCDEEKPLCRRCQDGGYVCDGYGQTPAARADKHDEGERNVALLKSEDDQSPLSRRLLPGNPLINYFRHHFFSCAVDGLMDLPHSTTFWTNTVVTHGHETPFLEPAIIALSAAHWLYLTGIENTGVQSFVNSRYHEAIETLVPVMATGNRKDLPAIMTSCVLFVSLESLRGNPAAALRHLEAGSRLFLDPIAQSTKTEPIMKQLAAIFHSLGIQVTLFSEKPLLPDPAPCLLSERQGDSATPFRTYHEANDALGRLDGCFNLLVWEEPSHCARFVDGECDCPDDCCCRGCQEWEDFVEQVTDFKARLQPLQIDLEDSNQPDNRQRLLCLKLQISVWGTIVEGESYGGDCWDADTTDGMLDLIEQILTLSAARPTFSMAIDLIPNLIFVYDSCPNLEYRRKVIDLLRLGPRRELIFDSEQTAAMLEEHLAKLSLDDGTSDMPVVDFSTWPQALIEFVPGSKQC